MLPDRLRVVLAVVYLIFNEGYHASGGDRLVRGELCAEAIRLGRLIVRLMPDEAEAGGLLALMLLHDARRAARVDEHGAFVALPHQDRSLWDAGRIREGERALEAALRLGRPGSFQIQAAIAALHLQPETDWAGIAGPLRDPRPLDAVPGRRDQPRGRRRVRRGPGGRPRTFSNPPLGDPRLRELRAAARGPRRPPAPRRRRCGGRRRLRTGDRGLARTRSSARNSSDAAR